MVKGDKTSKGVKVTKKAILKGDRKKKGTKKSKKSAIKTKKTKNQPMSLETTIHLHKVVHGCTFKKRARKAIKAIRGFVKRLMCTHDVCYYCT